VPEEIKKYQKIAPNLEQFLNPTHLGKLVIGKKYQLSEVVNKNDSILTDLQFANIDISQTYLVVAAADCVTLQTRKKKGMVTFVDHVIMLNLNEGQFACNINSLYTLNQDENVARLNIRAYRLSSLLNGFIIDNN